MSDIRKLINMINETTVAGAVGGGPAVPLGATHKRMEEEVEESHAPEVIEYGNWENSALVTGEKTKSSRPRSAKVVKSVYGEAEAKPEAEDSKEKTEAKPRKGIRESLEDVEESGLQAYLGNKKYGKEGMDALRKAGRAGASKEKMAKIRAKYDKLDEESIEESTGVTDYAPKSQGGTRKELLAKYHKTKSPKDAEAARKAGATQKELKGVAEAKLDEEDLIVNPAAIKKLNGLISKAADRTDHEVQMARSDLIQAAKNAQMVYELVKNIPEEQGIEGWVQEKIIKAADYLNTVREYLESQHIENHGETQEQMACPKCGGPASSEESIAEAKDACYHKVKSRYKVWPSAYASGALVKCRKVGAKNWGSKS
jgi:hypothetical protein